MPEDLGEGGMEEEYQVIEELGSGSFGSDLKTKHRETGKKNLKLYNKGEISSKYSVNCLMILHVQQVLQNLPPNVPSLPSLTIRLRVPNEGHWIKRAHFWQCTK